MRSYSITLSTYHLIQLLNLACYQTAQHCQDIIQLNCITIIISQTLLKKQKQHCSLTHSYNTIPPYPFQPQLLFQIVPTAYCTSLQILPLTSDEVAALHQPLSLSNQVPQDSWYAAPQLFTVSESVTPVIFCFPFYTNNLKALPLVNTPDFFTHIIAHMPSPSVKPEYLTLLWQQLRQQHYILSLFHPLLHNLVNFLLSSLLECPFYQKVLSNTLI